MIDPDERALMEETVRSAIEGALAADEDADIDAVLAQLGWREMLRDEPGDAIDIVFNALGATNATATALDDVILSALGREPRADLAVMLPRFAAWDPPGQIDADHLHAGSLATARAATAGEPLPLSRVYTSTRVRIDDNAGVDPPAHRGRCRAVGSRAKRRPGRPDARPGDRGGRI